MPPSAEAKVWWVISKLRMGYVGEEDRTKCARLLEEALVDLVPGLVPIHGEDCTRATP